MFFHRDGSMGFGWASLRCARAVAVLLIAVSSVANAAPGDLVRVCRGGDLAYEGHFIDDECDDAGGVIVDITVAELLASDMVGGWGLGGWTMWSAAYLAAHPDLEWQPFNPGGDPFLWESFASLGWGGGGSPEEPEPAFHELDLEAFGESWAAAFGLVFLCWGLGKGIGVVVRVVRN